MGAGRTAVVAGLDGRRGLDRQRVVWAGRVGGLRVLGVLGVAGVLRLGVLAGFSRDVVTVLARGVLGLDHRRRAIHGRAPRPERGQEMRVGVLGVAAAAIAGPVFVLATRHRAIDEPLLAAPRVAHHVVAAAGMIEAQRVAGLVGDGLAGRRRIVVERLGEREADRAPQHLAVGRRDARHPAAQAEELGPAADHDHRVRAAGRAAIDDLDRVGRELLPHAGHHRAPRAIAAGERRDVDLAAGAGDDQRAVLGWVIPAAGQVQAARVQVEPDRLGGVSGRRRRQDGEEYEQAHVGPRADAIPIYTVAPRRIFHAARRLTPARPGPGRSGRASPTAPRRGRRSRRGAPGPGPSRSPTRSPRSR